MSRPEGFTLIEVLVSLTVGAIVLLGARDVLVQLAGAAHDIRVRAVTGDRTANSKRVLRDLLGNVEVGVPGAQPFLGDADSTTFSSWCDVPAGWLERCTVILAFDSAAAPSGLMQRSLVARIGHDRRLVLANGIASARFRYLNSAANGGHWFDRWSAGISAPLAVGIILNRDTLVVRVGGI